MIAGAYCVDDRNTARHLGWMKARSPLAEANIHLRARLRDRNLIDQAAELVGANQSQFMLGSALKEAKNILLDQSAIHADAETFRKIMDWMDAEPTPAEAAGMRRILDAKAPWQGE
jgi:uncharacterized protein (DUF1778 family)